MGIQIGSLSSRKPPLVTGRAAAEDADCLGAGAEVVEAPCLLPLAPPDALPLLLLLLLLCCLPAVAAGAGAAALAACGTGALGAGAGAGADVAAAPFPLEPLATAGAACFVPFLADSSFLTCKPGGCACVGAGQGWIALRAEI